ncbi:hypothetical protein GQ602_000366 [Ophiocordyceps camponoti-floridani]|uniref:Uncharacterized protein n=1 Tax=Ophiocordyceps camponoti-floridani TaxID=2030778 RepID=A0A8H4QC30_9HYPO|nr:hypothetical protein GQ602_000366 [Ophiocordyceps camponoti-floridani]
MPFVGEGRNQAVLHPDRKRRRDGASSEAGPRFLRLYGPERLVEDSPTSRVMSKRHRGIDQDDDNDGRRLSPQQQKLASDGRLSRPAPPPSSTARAAAAAAVLLMPCHVCHRRPTKKSDLDSFAKCQGCRRRTCYVCIRECHNWLVHQQPPPPPIEPLPSNVDEENDVLPASYPMNDEDDEDDVNNHNGQRVAPCHGQHPPPPPPADEEDDDDDDDDEEEEEEGDDHDVAAWHTWGHRAVICSRCCVERGREGDVVCLGCLAGMAGS